MRVRRAKPELWKSSDSKYQILSTCSDFRGRESRLKSASEANLLGSDAYYEHNETRFHAKRPKSGTSIYIASTVISVHKKHNKLVHLL